MKRLFDIVFAAAGLIVLSPVFAVAALLVKGDSEGPVFFRQVRMGKDFKPFRIFKFRTMTAVAGKRGALVTVSGDARVTRIGKLLRKYKIDELPQLINVLKGEMSFVGPRPEVERYVGLFRQEYAKLLSVRPGITDPASLSFSNEEAILSGAESWEEEYVRRVLPEKIRLSSQYVESHGMLTDLKLIMSTVFRAARPHQG